MRSDALFVVALVGLLPWLTPTLRAQEEAPPVAAPAARPVAADNDEYYRAINGRIEELIAANDALQKNLSKLRDEVQRLSDEVARAGDRNKDTATQESIKHLKTAIEEVDSKRIADQKLVVAEFENLRKILEKASRSAPAPAPQVRTPAPKSNGTDAAPNAKEDGYTYKIREGDTASGIVTELRKKGMKTTLTKLTEANPKVNWNRLQVGQ